MPPKSSASTTGGKIAGKRRGRENTLGVGVTANPTVSVFEHHSEKELHDRLVQRIHENVSLTVSQRDLILDYWKTHKSESDENSDEEKFPLGEYFYAWFVQNRNALTETSLEEYLHDTAFKLQSFPAASLASLHQALLKSFQDENNNSNDGDDDGNDGTAATIFDIADETLFGCRHLVGDTQKIYYANARHVHIDGNEGFVSPSPHCAKFLDLWIESNSSLFIVGGSSGSGKTVVGVHLGKLWDRKQNHLLTKHINAADFTRNSRSVVCYLKPSCLRWSEVKASQLSSKTIRDEQVTETILEAIIELFSDRKKTWKASEVCSSTGSDDGTPRNVVIVIDELGDAPTFARGLASISATLARNLHRRFFGRPCSSDEQPRVAFIACGTGLAVQMSKDRSEHSNFISILLDEYPLPLRHMLSNFGLPQTRQHVYEPFLDRLEYETSSTRDTNTTSHALQPIELITVDLLRNARCAALFCVKMHSLINNFIRTKSEENRIRNLSRLPTYWCRFELPGLANRVIERFIDKNGLSSFRSPLNVLLCSLAVVVFKLPVLPKSIPKDLMTAFEPSGSDGYPLSYVLSCSCGVLVDQSITITGKKSLKKIPPNYFALPDTSDNNNNNNNNQSMTFFPISGRYFMSRASLAKIHFYLDINRRPFNENGLELSIGDFCFCVVAAAPYYMRMKEEILMLNNNNNNNNKNKNKPLMSEAALEQSINVDGKDVLYPLKKDLVFEETIRERATFPPSFWSRGRNLPAVKYFQYEQQLAGDNQTQQQDLSAQLQGVSNGESIVVMRTAHQESFADIIVAGLNKIVFIQVKSTRRSGSNISSSQAVQKVEFSKMGIGRAKSERKTTDNRETVQYYPTTNQQKLFRELVKNCRGSEDSKVQISAFILISSSESSDVGIVDFGVENNLKISVTGLKKVELKTATTITFNTSTDSADQNHPLFPAHPNDDTNTVLGGVKPRLLSGINSMSNYF